MATKSVISLSLAAALCVIPLAHAARVYTCKDADGNISLQQSACAHETVDSFELSDTHNRLNDAGRATADRGFISRHKQERAAARAEAQAQKRRIAKEQARIDAIGRQPQAPVVIYQNSYFGPVIRQRPGYTGRVYGYSRPGSSIMPSSDYTPASARNNR